MTRNKKVHSEILVPLVTTSQANCLCLTVGYFDNMADDDGAVRHNEDTNNDSTTSDTTEKEERAEKFTSTMVCFIMIFTSLFKMLLVSGYHSTDLEVHRNWLAITHSLPINEWYTECTSIWTLDYPPLFAWFQLLLSYPAVYFDPKMLDVLNLNYKSRHTILYLRLTVMASDLVLAYGTKECCDYLSTCGVRKTSKWKSRWHSPITVLQCLLLCNVGLIIVDHIHFQYNGMLLGILLLSIAAILKEQHLRAAFYFAVLLNMKHIFLYMAPVYFIYLLRNVCFSNPKPGYWVNPSLFLRFKFFQLALVVVTVFTISLGPFLYLGQAKQLILRLFPFQRGLFHSYWAPNVWALYSTVDKGLEVTFRLVGFSVPHSNITKGLTDIEIGNYSVLPNITPSVTFILTGVFVAPCLVKLWKFPDNPMQFVRCLALCALTAFIFGWHVHEKAILMAIVPLAVLAVIWQFEASIFFLLSMTGYYSLLPLLPPDGVETYVKYILLLLHFFYCCIYLANLFHEEAKSVMQLPLLTFWQSLYVFGFAAVSLLTTFLTFSFPNLVFLPLLITSAYCSLGIMYCWTVYYLYFITKHEENHKKKLH